MKIESTHSTDCAVHVVTLNGLDPGTVSIGADEYTRVVCRSFRKGVGDGRPTSTERGNALIYGAKSLVIDEAKGAAVRSPAFITTASGSIQIPKNGIFIARVDDCYSVDVNDKRRYAGDGCGNFGLVEEFGA